MDKTRLIPLPATLAEFMAFQEGLRGRELDDNAREALEQYLEIFNGVAVGKMDANIVIAEIDKALQTTNNPWFQGFMESARFWVLYAAETARNAPADGGAHDEV